MRCALPHPRLAPALWIALAALATPPASAQGQGLVVRDGSLGSGPLEVGPGSDPLGQAATYLITPGMGEQRGGNLFHSFLRFGIGAGEIATFTGPDPLDAPQSVSHVISRVTGGEPSQIDGRLRSTIPGADVWLFNPSGVGFGQGAELDVKGSFHAGTADYVGFRSGDRFYADRLQGSVLATAPPAAFGFLPGSAAAPLAVEGSTLEVLPGEALKLVASGDLSLTGATLTTHKTPEPTAGGGGQGFGRIRGRPRPGGHVGLKAQGQVKLTDAIVDGESVPSLVDVSGGAPGTISIRGGQIFIEKGSQVLAENTGAGPGGRIDVAASESLTVDAGLLSVTTAAAGNAGTIELRGGELRFRNGPAPANLPQRTAVGASAETTGSGAAGRIGIEAHSLRVEAGAGLSARTVGAGGAPASGAGGWLDIQAEELRIENPGFLSVESWGSRGDAGRIDIAAGSITLDAVRGILPLISADALAATGRAPVAPRDPTPARAGSIDITAGSIELVNPGFNGRSVDSDCINCSGGAGEVRIRAGHVSGQGRISASSLRNAPGDAGHVEVHAGTLELQGGGILALSEAAKGDAGRVEVHAGALTLLGGSISAAVSLSPSSAAPKAGEVEVHAGSVLLSSRGEITAHSTGSGPAGSVLVDAGEVVIGAGGQIAANTLGDGPAGSITLDVDSITLRGGSINAGTSGKGDGGAVEIVDADLVNLSGGGIAVDTRGSGNAGIISMDVESLNVTDGGFINAVTFSSGNAGTITIDADSVVLSGSVEDFVSGSAIRALSDGSTGNAGEIEITTRTLEIEHGGQINANSFSLPGGSRGGNAGTIDVTARDSIRLTNVEGKRFSLASVLRESGFFTGVFAATVFGGDGGSITLDAPEITVADGAFVATSTLLGGGDAGDVLLGGKIGPDGEPMLGLGKHIRIAGGAFVDSTSVLTEGAAGSVTLMADESIEVVGRHSVFEEDLSRVGSASLGEGAPGAVTLRAPRIVVDGGAVVTAAVPLVSGGAGTAGGAITLDAREIVVRGGGQINASSFGQGAAGDIEVGATESIRVEGTGSGIVSRTGASGPGGDVELRAPRIEVASGGEVSARSAQGLHEVAEILASLRDDGLLREPPAEATGQAGVVRLREAETIRLVGGRITTDAEVADGGDIHLQARRLVHLDAGEITASVAGGTGGNITIDPVFVILENGSSVAAKAGAGAGGRIQITTDNFFAFPGSEVSALADRREFSGTVEVHSPDVDLAGTLTPLPSAFLDAASLMRERCAARRSGERAGSFSVRGPGGIPSEPDGWLRAPVVLPDAAATAAAAPAQPVLLAALPGPLLAQRGCP